MDKKQVEVKKESKETHPLDNIKAQGLSLLPEFDRMINRFFGSRFQPLMTDWPTVPRHALGEMSETDNAYILTAEIPGIPREAIKINLSGNMLSIQAEHQEESGKQESARGYRRQYQNFRQSFTLPSNVDPEQIQANYENGILEVSLQKIANTPSKSIPVQAGNRDDSAKKEASSKKH